MHKKNDDVLTVIIKEYKDTVLTYLTLITILSMLAKIRLLGYKERMEFGPFLELVTLKELRMRPLSCNFFNLTNTAEKRNYS